MEYLFNLSVKETIRTQERLPVARSQGGNPPDAMVPKTVLVKSLNPGRNFRGGDRCSEQQVKSNYQIAKTYR